jgi:hypothetical protein
MPNLDPADKSRVVRQAPPEVAERVQHPDIDKAVARACEVGRDFAEAEQELAEDLRRRSKQRAEVEAGTARSAAEAGQPVLDERDRRRRSRTGRHR